ncbi:MAG TPA: phosphate ABC transporter substrate-binding protein PstS [Chitinophagaceae bacterium]
MKKFNYRKLPWLLSIVMIAVLTGCGGNDNGKKPGDDQTLLGAGSTFIYPLFSKMFSVYNKETGIRVNYQSIGSGGGILQLTNKTVDFGASDAPMNEEQDAKAGAPVLHIPMCSGAVVLSYNLPGVSDTLQLTPEVIANIFLGKIKKWNDPQIAAANPKVKLPDLPLIIAHRSDGSGTTNIFTSYLTKVSPEWSSRVGKGSSVNWPAGLGGKGNEGVSGLVKQTAGAIGYMELAYALQNKMSFAKIRNKSGAFITPGVASTSAASAIPLPADAKVSLVDTEAADGYPLSGFTWAIIYKEQNYNNRSETRAKELLNLLWWNVHQGQQYAEPLHYAPLSATAVSVTENILRSAT